MLQGHRWVMSLEMAGVSVNLIKLTSSWTELLGELVTNEV